jgi:hypothetical protein
VHSESGIIYLLMLTCMYSVAQLQQGRARRIGSDMNMIMHASHHHHGSNVEMDGWMHVGRFRLSRVDDIIRMRTLRRSNQKTNHKKLI